MNKEEMKQTIKGLRENQKTALKLLDENVELKQRIQKAKEHLKEVMKDEEEYEEDYIYNKYLLDILEGGKDDNN